MVADPGSAAMPPLLAAWTAAQTPERYLRHSGTTRTGPYDMNAAFMLLQVHGWDIHAVNPGRCRVRRGCHAAGGVIPGQRGTGVRREASSYAKIVVNPGYAAFPVSLLVAWTAAQTPEQTSVTPAPRVPGRTT